MQPITSTGLPTIRESSSFFPLKLMEMLENDKLADIVSWLPDGEAFVIHDKKRFASEVLPLYFNASNKFTSFTRRMNRWKFMIRPTSSKSRSVYHHPLFNREEAEKCIMMKPKPQKVVSRTKPKKRTLKHELPQYCKGSVQGAIGCGVTHDEQVPQPQVQHQHQHRQYWTSPWTPGQQLMHRHNMQTDPAYQGIYMSSLRDVYAEHQAQLAMQMELSHLAMMSSIMMTRDSPALL